MKSKSVGGGSETHGEENKHYGGVASFSYEEEFFDTSLFMEFVEFLVGFFDDVVRVFVSFGEDDESENEGNNEEQNNFSDDDGDL